MAKGEATRDLDYVPGEKRAKFIPAPEGDAQLQLVDFGKDGPMGWRAGKMGKFPNRELKFAVLGTEDEQTGNPKQIRDYVSMNPKALFRLKDLARASGYPEAIRVSDVIPSSPTDLAKCQALAAVIDPLLTFIKDQGIVLGAYLIHEEYDGNVYARVKYYKDHGENTDSPA